MNNKPKSMKFLAFVLYCLSILSLADAFNLCEIGFNQTHNQLETEIKYRLASTVLQIFSWMKASCPGQITTMRFINFATDPAGGRFYLATFRPFEIQNNSYFQMVNYVPVDVQSTLSQTIWQNFALVQPLQIETGHAVGIFYDTWNLPSSKAVIPYSYDQVPGYEFDTYLGFMSALDLRTVTQLRVGAELAIHVTDRNPAMHLGIIPESDPTVICEPPPQIENAYIVKGESSSGSPTLFYGGDFAVYECYDTFKLTTTEPTVCRAGSVWYPIPECVGGCGSAPTVPGAQIVFQSFTGGGSRYMDIVEYECLPGYQLHPGTPNRIRCDEFLRDWSRLPDCHRPGQAPPPSNVATAPTEPPTPRTFQTFAPFTFRTTRRAAPTPPPPPPFTCGEPPIVGYAEVATKTFPDETRSGPNDEVFYKCVDGFAFSKQSVASVKCSPETRAWTKSPICTRSCGEPPLVLGAVETQRDFQDQFSIPGSMAHYKCVDGRVLTTGDAVICYIDGRWSGSPVCMYPEDITTSTREPERTTKREVATPSPIQAIDAGPSCGRAPELSNAYIVTTTMSKSYSQIGDQVGYGCNKGYSMFGQHTITCLQTQRWSTPPNCEPGCGEAPIIGFADVTYQSFLEGQSRPGDRVTFTCNSGAVMTGKETVICEGSDWSYPRPYCSAPGEEAPESVHGPGGGTPSVKCPYVPNVWNAAASTFSFTSDFAKPGDWATYECYDGFHFKDASKATVSCRDNGEWSSLPQCIEGSDPIKTTCGSPPNVPSGYIRSQDFEGSQSVFGSTVRYSCASGHTMIGTDSIFCDQDQQWSQTPRCQRTSPDPAPAPVPATPPPPPPPPSSGSGRFCQNPPTISNGRIDQKNFDARAFDGARVTYACDPGYEPLNGRLTIVCLNNGQWTPAPQCIGDVQTTRATQNFGTCPTPSNMQNGGIQSASYDLASGQKALPGDTVTYGCTSGYTLEGSATVTCDRSTLRWSQTPTCKREQAPGCGSPPQLENARELMRSFSDQSSDNGRTGDSVVYTCDDGWTLIGRSNRVFCLGDGTWAIQFECRNPSRSG